MNLVVKIKRFRKLLCVLSAFMLIFIIFNIFYLWNINSDIECDEIYESIVKRLNYNHNFSDFQTDYSSNDTINTKGLDFNIVPNIVHYILFDVHHIEIIHFISILSVLKNHKPDLIYIHCDCHQLNGDYYQRVLRVANKTNTPIIVRTVEKPTQIFGKALSKQWLNWHSSDITRLRVLQEFGGIYLDRDVYVVQSLEVFFKYEMTIYREENKLENAFIIAYKNARFLRLWLDSYHDYRANSWFWNGGEMPNKCILQRMPELIHRLKSEFGVNYWDICPMLYYRYYKNWQKDHYAIHLIIRGDKLSPPCVDQVPKGHFLFDTINEENIKQLNITFREMARIVFEFEDSINGLTLVSKY